jgi:hypothetical protein
MNVMKERKQWSCTPQALVSEWIQPPQTPSPMPWETKVMLSKETMTQNKKDRWEIKNKPNECTTAQGYKYM